MKTASMHPRSQPRSRCSSATSTLVTGLSIVLLCVYSTVEAAQADERSSPHLPFVDPATIDPRIPTPSSIIGHEVGEQAVRYDPLMRYLKALAASSDRITLNPTARPTKVERWSTCLLPARKTISDWIRSRPATENSLTLENLRMLRQEGLSSRPTLPRPSWHTASTEMNFRAPMRPCSLRISW